MRRKFWNVLETWDKRKDKMPLMIVGPRQVGKTYIIDKYCSSTYQKYCYINLLEDKRPIDWFRDLDSFHKKIEMLEITYNLNLKDSNTILFVDEIQESEELIEALKAFCENGYVNIICAGSLLGVRLKRFSKSYPVGKVYEENMYPMDFEEYLWAIGKERYIDCIIRSFKENKECLFHKELLEEFKRFIFLGGMPQIIQNYIDNDKNLSSIDGKLIKNIINSYILDMKKYNKDNNESIRIERIFKNVPSQLAKENQKFVYAKIDLHDNRKRDYVTALDWLIASRLVLPCYLVNSPTYPLLAYLEDASYKLFLNDTGILLSIVDIEKYEVLLDNDYPFKGVVVENYVAHELVKQGFKLYYWSRKSNKGNAEVDFVIQHAGMVIPIEVKAGTDMKSKSLDIYKEKFNPRLMVKISAKNFGYDENNRIKTIPLYAVFCLKEYL